MNRLAIFDCDGTLVDSQANICVAMEECFVRAGFEAPPRERTRRVVGLSLVEAMRAMRPGAESEIHLALAEGYKQVFQGLRAEGLVEEPLYDGIADLLETLEAEGWLLAIATGKSDRGLALCLDRHGLAGRFVSLQTADRHPSKPHPSMVEQALADAGASPATTIVIGDTSFDMAMAAAAGATPIGAGWGYHDGHELIAAGAIAVAERPLDVLTLIREHVDG